MTILAALLLVALIAWEARRWPTRKAEAAKAASLDADANDAIKFIAKIARKRAQSRAIPVPIMPEDTTDVIVLHPHPTARQSDAAAAERRRERPSEYRIVAARPNK